jgi:hypothetical protein
VIGPGKMGLPVARDLRGREFGVIGHRRSGSPELAGGAASWPAARPTLTQLRPGTIGIEMSTIDVSAKAGPVPDELQHRSRAVARLTLTQCQGYIGFVFSIGEFARHGRVSVRMLRHYDSIGLLRPAGQRGRAARDAQAAPG